MTLTKAPIEPYSCRIAVYISQIQADTYDMLLYGITLEVLYAYKLQINININKVFKDPRPFEIVARATSLDL